MTRFLTACALVIGLYGFAVRADEMDIPLDKVPAKAMVALKKQFPNAKLVEASTDTVDCVVEYTVTLSHKKETQEVTLTGDGKILEIARELAFKELPKAVVVVAFYKQYPKAKVDGVWEMTVPGVQKKSYQIDCVTADGKRTDGAFSGPVVDCESRVGQVSNQRSPLIPGVSDGLPEQTLRRRGSVLDFEPVGELDQDRPRPCPSPIHRVIIR